MLVACSLQDCKFMRSNHVATRDVLRRENLKMRPEKGSLSGVTPPCWSYSRPNLKNFFGKLPVAHRRNFFTTFSGASLKKLIKTRNILWKFYIKLTPGFQLRKSNILGASHLNFGIIKIFLSNGLTRLFTSKNDGTSWKIIFFLHRSIGANAFARLIFALLKILNSLEGTKANWHWAVAVVKWSACLPSIPTIWVWIPLKSTIFL